MNRRGFIARILAVSGAWFSRKWPLASTPSNSKTIGRGPLRYGGASLHDLQAEHIASTQEDFEKFSAWLDKTEHERFMNDIADGL